MIRFTVPGKPATKGSFRAYTIKRRDGRIGARVDNDNPRCKSWQESVGWAARAAMRSAPLMTGAVAVDVVFRFERPAKIKRAGDYTGPLPDIDKLERALLDGMTGIVYVDDAQVAQVHKRKEWGPPGVSVSVLELPAPSPTPILDMARAAVTDRPDVLAVLAGAKPRSKR